MRISLRFLIASGLILAILNFNSLCIAEPIVVSAKAKGRATEISVPAGADTNKIIVYATSKGNESAALFAEISGPVGVSAEVTAIKQKGSPLSLALSSKKGFKLTMEPKLRIRRASDSVRTSRAVDCPQSVIDTLVELSAFVPQWQGLTPEELCQIAGEGLGGGSGGEPDDRESGGGFDVGESPGKVTSVGVLYKDTCDRTKKYLVRVMVDISAVDPAVRAAGFKINVALKGVTYQGKKAASIKEASDGKFAPNPLLLMNSMGCYGSAEKIYMMQWSGTRILRTVPVEVEDCIGYKGYTFTRSVVSGLLNGGRGTFTILNPSRYSAYSVCFNLVRNRQYVNGYPN